MKKITILFLLPLLVLACRSKRLTVSEHQQQAQSQTIADSTNKKTAQNLQESLFISQKKAFEIELITDTLKGKELVFERRYTPTSEKITLKGGSLKLKTRHIQEETQKNVQQTQIQEQQASLTHQSSSVTQTTQTQKQTKTHSKQVLLFIIAVLILLLCLTIKIRK